MSIAKVSGSFTGTGVSSSIVLDGLFNLSLSGFGVATVSVDRSFDNGSTWSVVDSYTADTELVGEAPENDVIYRVNCSAYTSGTIVYRLSK